MIDSVTIEVFSDSDMGGLLVNAIETSERSGDFISTITLSSDSSSSGNRLYAIPGDAIFAKYNDHTLPKPFLKSDNQYVETFAKIDHSTLPITRIHVSPIFLSDGFGNSIIFSYFWGLSCEIKARGDEISSSLYFMRSSDALDPELVYLIVPFTSNVYDGDVCLIPTTPRTYVTPLFPEPVFPPFT